MSANNAVYVAHESSSGEFSVWYDGCVDNPFPSSCSLVGKFTDELEAFHKAVEVVEKAQIVEYGISFLKMEKIPCSRIGDERWEYCCSRAYGHDGDHEYDRKWC